MSPLVQVASLLRLTKNNNNYLCRSKVPLPDDILVCWHQWQSSRWFS